MEHVHLVGSRETRLLRDLLGLYVMKSECVWGCELIPSDAPQ